MGTGLRISLALAALVAFLAAGYAVTGRAEASTPTLSTAVRVAKSHVTQRFKISRFRSVQAVRSKRNPSWALVEGFYRKPSGRRPNVWTVYLRARGGDWRVVYAGIGMRAFAPKVKAPCDIWPPFSEPDC